MSILSTVWIYIFNFILFPCVCVGARACMCVCVRVFCVQQHALRLMAFGQIYKVLEMEPLPSNKPSQKYPWSDKDGVYTCITACLRCLLQHICLSLAVCLCSQSVCIYLTHCVKTCLFGSVSVTDSSYQSHAWRDLWFFYTPALTGLSILLTC